MKKFYSFLILFLSLISTVLYGQSWSTTSGSLYSPINSTSYVGVGILPQYKLDVNGKMCIRPYDIVLGLNTSYLYWSGHILNIGTPPNVYAYNFLDFKPGGSSSGPIYTSFRMYTSYNLDTQIEKLHLTSYGDCWFDTNGNFGIGTTSPQATLDVRGNIRANEIVVNVPSGADFVFEPEYNLMPISELSAYLYNNHHLPNVQSSFEMETNGVSISEFQIQLLRKVEELTLYIIEQQKIIDDLQQYIFNLKE